MFSSTSKADSDLLSALLVFENERSKHNETTNQEFILKKEKSIMTNINFYFSLLAENDIDFVKARVERDAIAEIEELIADWDDSDVYEMLRDTSCCEDIHPMDDFDEVFEDYSARETLEELTEIDLYDDWFDADSKRSSCDVLDLIGCDANDVAKDIYNEVISVDDDDINDVMEEAECIIDALDNMAKRIDSAKKLFKQALLNDVDEVISVLWNLNS